MPFLVTFGPTNIEKSLYSDLFRLVELIDDPQKPFTNSFLIDE